MAFLQRHWERVTPVSVLLYPLSLLFAGAVALRRAAYRAGLLRGVRLPVPVVVVGNIQAGGTGKTPLVLWIAAFLRERGRRPGIISRGYGGASPGPEAVAPDGDPRRLGDEPVLLAQRAGCPVWIGADRVAAGRALLAAHPACDVIVSDDGLQHYRLARDAEIVVVDGDPPRNRWMLPAGPLREPPARIAESDAVVVNGDPAAAPAPWLAGAPVFPMTLQGGTFHQLREPAMTAGPDRFRGRAVDAIAGIGRPARFFRHLQELGVSFTAHAFPDHHPYGASDVAFPGAEAVLMTEKDAVKCLRHADERHWALRVDAKVDPALGDLVLRKIESRITNHESRP